MKKTYFAPETFIENMGVEDGLLLEVSSTFIPEGDGGWVKVDNDVVDLSQFTDENLGL